MKWLSSRASRAKARSDVRHYRSLQLSLCEPRHLLTGLVFDSIQSMNTQITLAPTTRLQFADVNGDGDSDLVAFQERQVLVFDNHRGDFTLSDRQSRPVSPFDPERSRMLEGEITDRADLDGDGDQDLIFFADPGHVAWIENVDGQGAFDRLHFVTDTFYEVVPGDVDGDGDLDLVENGIHGGLIWYENVDGRGLFSRSHRVTIPATGESYFADIDRDRDLDFVLYSSGQVHVYTNPGRIAIEWPHVEYAMDRSIDPFENSQLVLWDNNSWVDYVAAYGSRTIVIHDLGRPDAEVPRRVSVIPTESNGYRVIDLADLDGDHRADQILFQVGSNRLAWSPQRADGVLSELRPIHTIRNLTDVVAGDWDADQDTDLLVRRNDSIVEWIENRDGLGDFDTQFVSEPFLEVNYEGFLFGESVSRAIHRVLLFQSTVAVRMLDWSGDGREDLMTESRVGPGFSRIALQWYPNEGGRFAAPQILYTGPTLSTDEITRWTAADVDGDGLPELALIAQGQVHIFRHRVEAEPFIRVALRDGIVHAIELVDVDRDGDRDLFLVEDHYDWTLQRTALWMENTDGRGTFGEPKPLIAGLANDTQWSWHDMDADGREEFVVTRRSDEVTTSQIWRYDTMARSIGLVFEQSVADVFRSFIVDLDRDGANDILHQIWQNGALVVLWNRGLDAPFPSETLATGLWGALRDSGDIDSDGDIDLVVTADRLVWLENQPQHRRLVFHDATDDLLLNRYHDVFLNDTDGDHDVDLIAIMKVESQIDLFVNRHVQWDWSQNRQLDRADLDSMCLALADHSNDLRFDVNHDGSVNAADLTLFRQRTLGVSVGDLDDDSRFASSDLVMLMQRGKFQKVGELAASWSEGDFDCNGRFDTDDLVKAMVDTGYSGWASAPLDTPVKLNEAELFNGDNELVTSLPFSRMLQADIDADGDDDLLLREGVLLTWYRNDGSDRPMVIHWTERSHGNTPSAVADLDGDGDLDWYLSEGVTGSYDYWLENVDGLGHFEVRHETRLDRLSDQIAPQFADWDRDGDLDMIAARDGNPEAQAASLVLFENKDGRGAFHEAMTLVPMQERFYSGIGQRPFALADVDNDGWIDLVHHRSVWYRNLQGSLNEREEVSLELPEEISFATFQSVVVVDLDHDGDHDLVRLGSNRLLYFAYNDGLGRFSFETSNISATRFSVTDIDRNGRWELIVGDLATFSWSEQIETWNDLARAGFEIVHRLDGYVAFPPAFIDRDSDGLLDLLVASNQAKEPLLALVSDSPDLISWSMPVPLVEPLSLQQLETFDVDDDGRLDVLVRFDRLSDVQWIRNLGNGQWAERADVPSDMPWGGSLASLDLDGDGDKDVAHHGGWWQNQPGLPRSDWRFHSFPIEANAWQDMDHDGDVDLIGANRWIANNRGAFSLDEATLIRMLPGDVVMAAADFNDDGYVDILAKNGTSLSVYYRNANEQMDRQTLESAGYMSVEAIWDIDRDGDLDVVSSAGVWNENEGGRFVRSRSLTKTKRQGAIVDQIVADFDEDGFGDLIVAWGNANDLVEIRLE